MSTYEYTALDSRGRTQKGVVEGDSPRDVRDTLRGKGFSPLTVEEVRGGRAEKGASVFSSRGVGLTDLTLATRQLATLIRASLPLEEALEVVSKQTSNRRLCSILLAVRAHVMSGHSLAYSLADFPSLFSDLYRETVAAGEQTGKLDGVFERLADYLENSHRLRQKVGLSLIYPVVVMTFAILVTIALLTYVVPEVTKVFADFGHKLPLLTRVLMAISDFLRERGLVLGGILGGVGIGLKLLLKREGVRYRFHGMLLMVPLVGRLVRGLNTARFVRTLGILISSGIPVLEGLGVSARVIAHLPMRRAVENAAVRVREGGGLHQALAESGVFSPMVIHLIASGEASGNLDGMMDRAATAQEQEVEALVAALTGVMEPLLIILMGGVVVTIVVAILLPVFDLNTLIK